ncbi:MAG: sigma-70 family RNA polymerase sigma factor [Bacteroidota bacterium]|nr:MAG: sigma-70 family RNA polymerase sigma factor [Bacteroidota bacterium]
MTEKTESQHFQQHLELIEACRKNDTKAQIEVYRFYCKAMFNVCLRLVKNSVEAEDLMQEAFISAFEKLDQYRAEVSFGAWLKKIVINKCIDFLKKKKIQFVELDEANRLEEDIEPDNLEGLTREIEKIKTEINLLPDGYRTVLNLFVFEGYDHDEIAQILGIAASTSRSQYARAKAILYKKLKEQHHE